MEYRIVEPDSGSPQSNAASGAGATMGLYRRIEVISVLVIVLAGPFVDFLASL